MWPFKKKEPQLEQRSAMQGFTAELMAARESYLAGRSGVGELTGCVQSCVSLWEHGLSIAEVSGTDYLTPHVLGIIGRSLALRGECVLYLAPDRLLPASDWDLSTRGGVPRAYRLSISEAGGGVSQTALASEVIHIRIGACSSAPWAGTAPLRRASLTGALLQSLESALGEVYDLAPLGSQIVSFQESPSVDLDKMGASFRGRRGRVLLKESVNVTSAGGPVPNADWSPSGLSPDLSKSMATDSLEAAKHSIMGVYGVLPCLVDPNATGPAVREAQRHLMTYFIQPVAGLLAHEASLKLDSQIKVDAIQGTSAFDLGQKSRSLAAIIEALALAKEKNVDVSKALELVRWDT